MVKLLTNPPINFSKIADFEYDVAVIGAGGSGLAAAVSAGERGARVIVLERRPIPGGSTLFAEGPFAAESPTQKRLNIHCTNDELFNIQMYYNHWTINPRLVREIINKSGDTINLLERKGIEFYLPLMFPNQTPLEWHNPKKGCPEIINTFIKECNEFNIPVLFNTRCLKILTSKHRQVSGLLAKARGKEINIKTRSVVIATGGYAGNISLLKKYSPYFNTNNLKVNILNGIHSGDGIRMAFDIGADSEGLGKLLLHGPVAQARSIFGLAIEADTIWINRNGERFMQESASFSPFESANGVLRKPEQVMFSIFDEAIVQNAVKNGLERPFESSLHSSFRKNKLEQALQDEYTKGNLLKSGSWSEIAAWVGIDLEILKNTVDEYNSSCDKGCDDLFAKNRKNLKPIRHPPYYITRCVPGMLSSLGGIKINHRTEVLDKNNLPIPGLYAVGNDAGGGFSGDTYNVRLAGAGCGFAFNSGRIAGEKSSDYVKANRE